jgi:methionyl-tRNA formyltransferase
VKIGFFGTPEIAAYCLKHCAGQFDIAFAVTQEDKPQGRSSKPVPSSVKCAALELSIPVLQPASLKDPEFIHQLSSYNADIFVVVAYGRILPRILFDLPRLKTINLHPSLLPKYRGAAPVESAIRAGETVTGITVQYINEKLDAGDIVLQETLAVDESSTSGDLYETILPHGAELLIRAIKGLVDNSIIPVPQKEEDASYCGKFTKDGAKIDWFQKSAAIHNHIRAYNPKPVAWTIFRGAHIRIWKSCIYHDDAPSLAPGELLVIDKKRLITGTADFPVEIISVQPETKKVMDIPSFINGYKPSKGECFS